MGNFWLDQAEMEQVANDLADYLIDKIKGKKLVNPKETLKTATQNFFKMLKNGFKFQNRIDVEAIIAPAKDSSGYWITNINVVCQ